MKTMTQISLLFVMAVSLLAACSPAADQGQDPAQVAVGEPFELQGGEEVSIGNGAFLISVVGFVEDSRCPMNARCIIPGQATVRLRVNGEDVALTLWADEDKSRLALEGGYTLQLLEINPFPGSPEEAAGASPSARLVVVAN